MQSRIWTQKFSLGGITGTRKILLRISIYFAVQIGQRYISLKLNQQKCPIVYKEIRSLYIVNLWCASRLSLLFGCRGAYDYLTCLELQETSRRLVNSFF